MDGYKFHTVVLWIIISVFVTTIKCENNKHNTLHFNSYNFNLNNQDEWSIDYNNNNQQDIVACTIKIPLLCIHYQYIQYESNPIITLFYNNTMFNFQNDNKWTQISTIYNDNYNENENPEETEDQTIRRLVSKCDPFYKNCKGKTSRTERRKERRVDRRQKRDKRRKDRFETWMDLVKKTRPKLGTYLGAPHIMGPPSWIFGSAPLDNIPRGMLKSPSFRTQFAGFIDPAEMGQIGMEMPFNMVHGYPYMMPFNIPRGYGRYGYGRYGGYGNGCNNYGCGGYGRRGRRRRGRKRKKRSKRKRRRSRRDLMEDNDIEAFNVVMIRKCVIVCEKEICLIYNYSDKSIELEYNIPLNNYSKYNKEINKLVTYKYILVWNWKYDQNNLIQCNFNDLCIFNVNINGMDHMIMYDNNDNKPSKLDIMNINDNWSEIYDINDNKKRLCGYLSNFKLCSEFVMNKNNKIEEMTISIQK